MEATPETGKAPQGTFARFARYSTVWISYALNDPRLALMEGEWAEKQASEAEEPLSSAKG
jgi:hypothetical protein